MLALNHVLRLNFGVLLQLSASTQNSGPFVLKVVSFQQDVEKVVATAFAKAVAGVLRGQ